MMNDTNFVLQSTIPYKPGGRKCFQRHMPAKLCTRSSLEFQGHFLSEAQSKKR
jgi:hypothetical protein